MSFTRNLVVINTLYWNKCDSRWSQCKFKRVWVVQTRISRPKYSSITRCLKKLLTWLLLSRFQICNWMNFSVFLWEKIISMAIGVYRKKIIAPKYVKKYLIASEMFIQLAEIFSLYEFFITIPHSSKYCRMSIWKNNTKFFMGIISCVLYTRMDTWHGNLVCN